MHQKALEQAVYQIGTWKYKKFVQQVILYGSCARGDYTADSDVDIFVELNGEVPVKELRNFRSKMKSMDGCDIEADIHFSFTPLSECDGLFYENIKKEGVLLWAKQ